MKHKVIIDTDPGIDDAMAIFFAFQAKDIDVIGLTTVFGNVPVDMAADNALRLCDIAGVDIPVTKGVSAPWVGPESSYAHFVHGDNGFGDVPLAPPKHKLDPRSSAQFIIDMARLYPGEITVAAIAPLGNIALALRLEPELPKLLKSLTIMGGAAHVPGNVTPVAEANIWNDAEAADIVFNAGFNLHMFGLDVTKAVLFRSDDLDALKSGSPTLGGFVEQAAQFYMDFYSPEIGERACYFHDVLPLAHLLQPELFEFETGQIRVATDPLCVGQTVFANKPFPHLNNFANTPPVQVATKVDAEQLRALYFSTFS
jgi:inosine-uridine nucleoside N-ribohydrolase